MSDITVPRTLSKKKKKPNGKCYLSFSGRSLIRRPLSPLYSTFVKFFSNTSAPRYGSKSCFSEAAFFFFRFLVLLDVVVIGEETLNGLVLLDDDRSARRDEFVGDTDLGSCVWGDDKGL